ncbi:MAG: hypothetical protein R2731_08420 [Nocardioides sp.]
MIGSSNPLPHAAAAVAEAPGSPRTTRC